MGIELLSPWDAMQWFDLPIISYPVTVNGTFQMLIANQRRVALIVGNPQAVICTIGLDPTPPTGQGLQVPSGVGPFMITHEQFGPLVQAAWFLSSGVAGGVITVVELVLREWPKSRGGISG